MSDFSIEHFGGRLTACRSALGMTQADFSELLGCTNGAYSLYERGKRQPSLEIINSLCQDFGVSLDFLISCMSPDPLQFGERLSRVMARCPDKPLGRILSAVGVDERAAAIFTSGAAVPNAKVLRRICLYYGCSCSYLIGLSDQMTAPEITPVSIQIAGVARDPLSGLDDASRAKALAFIDFLAQQQGAEGDAKSKEA